MVDPGSISGVWWKATAIVRRYPWATVIPAAVLGGIAEVPHYIIEDHLLLDNALTYVTAALASYLYLAHAEEIVIEYESGMQRLTLRGMFRELREAIPFVWRLLVIPGAWLYTRLSIATPVIRHENLEPAAALKRSNALVRTRFWFALATATLAFDLEEALVHAGAVAGYLVSGRIHGEGGSGV